SFWTNYLGGDWNIATNWNNQIVPNGSGGNLPSAAITNIGFYTITNDLSVSINEFFFSNHGGRLTGSGNLHVEGPFTWQGGSFSGPGTITARAGIDIITAAHVSTKGLSAKTLINSGPAIWSGDGTITLMEGAIISNASGAIFDCTGDGIMENGLGENRVYNAGLFRKTGGTNTTRIDVPFSNTGTIEVQAGTLSFNAGPNS